MKHLAALLILIFCAGSGFAKSQPAAPAQPPAEQDMVLDLTCQLPADGPEVNSGVVVTKLFEYDPRLADTAATELTQVTLTGLTHTQGKRTIFRMPLRGKRSAGKKYYVTVFVQPPNEEQRLYFIDGFQKVLKKANDQVLNITLTPMDR